MPGPSDAFFRDTVATVGGELLARLPELEKRQAAARALGQELSLAAIAAKMGLVDQAKLDELASLESGGSDVTGSRARKRPRARGARSGMRPATAPSASPGGSGGVVLFLALAIGALVLAIAFVIRQRQQQEHATVEAPRPDAPRAAPSPAPSAAPSPVADADRERQAHLAKLALAAIQLARAGDLTGAKRDLARIRLDATPADEEIVRVAEREVDELQRAAEHPGTSGPSNPDPDGHRIPPVVEAPDGPVPAPSPAATPDAPAADESAARAAYVVLRASLDAALAKLDLEGARAILAAAPPASGSVAKDLELDRKIPDALDRFLAVASNGVSKTKGTVEEFRLAAGPRIKGKVTDVSGAIVTIQGSQGEQLVKVSELERAQLLDFATSGLTKQTQQDYAVGRGLVLLYSGDLDGARTALEASDLPLAKDLLERIAREGAPRVAASPADPGKPAPPPGAGALPAADLAALREKLHTAVTDEGDGSIGLHYKLTDATEAEDWDARGSDRWEIADTAKPGRPGKPFRCLEWGISSYEDVLVLHRMPTRGDCDFTCTFYVNDLNPETSNLIFVLGFDRKKGTGAGALFGQQLVRFEGKRLVKGTPEAPDGSRFANARDCTVRIARKGDKVTLWWNGVERGSMTAAGLDGHWGFIAHNLRIGIRKVLFRGTPDMAKVSDGARK